MNYINDEIKEIVEELELKLTINKVRYDLPIDSLFNIGVRKNPKRNFLFVSKILGKHIPVNPETVRLTGVLLADAFATEVLNKKIFNGLKIAESLYDYNYLPSAIEEAKKKIDIDTSTLVIGFAETATALGHSVFSAFSGNIEYIHTTREELNEIQSAFNFEEEHSHATSHLCYSTEKNYFNKFNRIILVDDEMTTGKTSLNLIESLNKHFPNKEYSILSILDWRKEEEIELYRKKEIELGIKINEISLLQGFIEYSNKEIKLEEIPLERIPESSTISESISFKNLNIESYYFKKQNSNDKNNFKKYLKSTGRFGISATENEENEKIFRLIGTELKKVRIKSETLCLGEGEFMYLPSRVSAYMGSGVSYYSTTRSPIFSQNKKFYPIKNSISFNNYEDKTVENFIYNIKPNEYKEVFFFTEREMELETQHMLTNELGKLGVEFIKFISF